MDQSRSEELRQSLLDFKCKKIVLGDDKSSVISPRSLQMFGNVPHENWEAKIGLVTPEKTNESSHAKCTEEAIKLSESYKTIAEFFGCMICSLRLLGLRKRLPTFQNVRTQVEILARREFSYRHLAGIKYILPEAIQIEKILIHDQKTLCMKPDMKITLLLDVVEGCHEQSAFIALRQLFDYRLLNFFKMQPEDFDIPEAIPPEPFNHESQTNIPKVFLMASGSQPPSVVIEQSNSSHLYPSFSKHFSQKSIVAKTEKTQLLASPVTVTLSSTRSDCLPSEDIEYQIQKKSSDICSEPAIISSPVPMIYPHSSVCSSEYESPIVKLPLATDSLTLETPAQMTPKQSMPSCDDKLKITSKQKLTVCYAKRSLDFCNLEGDESASKSNADAMPQTTKIERISVEVGVSGSSALSQKVEKNNGYMQEQISSSLTDLVPVIFRIFQSANFSLITKEELIHKIIMHNCDIIDRREVEEHIKLLENLVPDWICRNLAPCGDILYDLRRVPDLDSVRARLSSSHKPS
ncbi:CDT1-like protein a, chloroplastic isoform X2 [Malania oleifera]|uniref:CDT1-like protein a, chloroplastic isoform X2 n=1 Tax=Malania oleifera TaxID=397392 RepID=UPI0025ADE047|nr:CDT1-like protein a, chloroplastic isoform X2 [Malania oleifera]XP_057969208.1 CDT1-like protein a, chloroplastic isoform X2 [Malania oleifera]XP_057969209.1 CDT1-like protein a, chloroplastic isoform X2 [Malania oleifera]